MRVSKRILSVALVVALMLTAIPVTFAQAETENDYSILFKSDFEKESQPSDYGTFSLNAGDYADAPGRDGKAVKMRLNTWNNKMLSYDLNETIPNGTVYIGYDYYSEDPGYTLNVYTASPEQTHEFGDSMGLRFDAGTLNVIKTLKWGDWGNEVGNYKVTTKEWHRIETWLDFDAKRADFFIDGFQFASAEICDNLPCFSGWGHSIRGVNGADGIEYIDNLMIAHIKKYDAKTVVEGTSSTPNHWNKMAMLEISTEVLAGTFFDEEAKFSVSVDNLIQDTIPGKLSVRVTSEKGKVVLNETREVSVENLDEKQEDFFVKLPEYGYYDVKATFDVPGYTEKGYLVEVIEYPIVRAKESEVPNLLLGYSAHSAWGYGIAEQHRWNEVLSKLGFSIAREAFYWADVQKETDGPIAFSDRNQLIVDAAKENNIRFLIQLAGTPGKHHKNTLPETKEELDAFYTYVYETVKLLKETCPDSQFLELYNEYQHQPAEVAVAMQKVGYEAAKAANPDIIVCGGITARVPDWIDEILKLGYGEYMDVFSVHPYSIEAKPEDKTFRYGTSVEQTQAVRNALDKYGYQDTGIIISELSYSASNICETEVVQAAYGLRQFIMTSPYIGEFIWYNNINKTGKAGTTVTEANFGLLKSWANDPGVPYQAKPVALAFGAYNDLMAQGEILGRAEIDNEDIYIYKFKTRNNEDVIAVWNWLDEIETIGLKLGTDTAELYDMYGNKTDIVADENGIFNLPISGELTYIKGNFSNIELTSSRFKQQYTEFDVCMGESYSIPVQLPVVDGAVVEVIADDNFEITRADFNAINFNVGFEEPNNSAITVMIKKGGRVLYQYDILINYVDQVVFSGALKAYDTERYMWEINISNSRKSDISAKLTITEPESLAGKTVSINKIVGGDSRKIKISIPREDTNTDRISMSGTIEVTSKGGGQIIPVNLSKYVGCIKYTTKTPVIDGKIETGEWATYLPMRVKNGEHAVSMEWNGLSDLSAEVYTMIDDEFMYLGAVVKDDIHYDKDTPKRVWSNDSIQFAVATERRSGARNSEFGVGISNGEVTLQRYTSQQINEGVVDVPFDERTEYAVKRYEDKKETVYEVKMKLSDIYDVVPDVKTLKNVAFALCVNDHDGVSRGWMEYTEGGIAGTKDSGLYMDLPVYGN